MTKITPHGSLGFTKVTMLMLRSRANQKNAKGAPPSIFRVGLRFACDVGSEVVRDGPRSPVTTPRTIDLYKAIYTSQKDLARMNSGFVDSSPATT
jgi:hypothetical protein